MIRRPVMVSVIIPAFNAARYLLEAIASVRQQTHPAHEIIVVDDGSTDDTANIVRRLEGAVTYLRQPHQGSGAARNRGVEAARGEYLAFLDADDLFVQSKLAMQIDHLERPDGPDISLGCVEEFVAADLSHDEMRRLRPRNGVLAGGVPGAALMTRATFDRAGWFESSWRVGEFADWYLRAMDVGLRAATLDTVVLRRRLHGNNLGVRERASRVDYARIMKRALDRRRRAADELSGR